MAKAAQNKRAANVLVRFKNVSIGESTGSIGVAIAREILSLAKADELLCGRRLAGVLCEARDEEDADQTNFLRGDRHRLKGSFDVRKYGVGPKGYSATLNFALSEIDTAELLELAGKTGRILADGVYNIEEENNNKPKTHLKDEDAEEGENSEDVLAAMKGRKAARDGKAAAAGK